MTRGNNNENKKKNILQIKGKLFLICEQKEVGNRIQVTVSERPT